MEENTPNHTGIYSSIGLCFHWKRLGQGYIKKGQITSVEYEGTENLKQLNRYLRYKH